MNIDDQLVRCQYSYCKQRDFLPFTCHLCEQQYCLEHKDPKTHECDQQSIYNKATVCPKCKMTIRYQSNQDPELLLRQHKCEEIKEIQKCSICNVKLTLTTEFDCKHCTKPLCLKHRMPEDHNCRITTKTQCACIIM